MSLICLSGDWHLRGKDFKQKLVVIEEMLKICKERNVSHLFNAGDTFDTGEVGDRNIAPEIVIKSLADLWSKYQIRSTFIAGNHDLWSSGSGLNFLHHSYIDVVDYSCYGYFEDFDMFYIPWVDNNKNYYQGIMNQLHFQRFDPSNPKKRLILGHLNIIGCSLGKHGYCSAEHYYSFGLPDLVLSNYRPHRMFFGHIHRKDDLGDGAMYLGALSQLRFDEDEGKIAGFHLYDTVKDELEFVSLDHCAPRYYTIKEHELARYDATRDFIRFHTDFPEKYEHLKPNVKAIRNKLAREVKEDSKVSFTDLGSNQLNINHLVDKYCSIKSLVEPTSSYYIGEKKNLHIALSEKMTGLEFIHNVRLKGVGVHKDTLVEFSKGFNVISGANGRGKTTIFNGIVGALYENVPERGNIKNMMEKGGYIEVNLTAKGQDYQVTKSMENKRFVSSLNDTDYTLVSNFAGAIEPIFGDANTFTKLVYMDQNNKFDLVTTADSKRLEVLRKLLDLDAFEAKQEVYKKELKECQTKLAKLAALDTEITQLEKELAENFSLNGDDCYSEEYEKGLKEQLAAMKASNKANENYQVASRQYTEMVNFEDENDVQEFWDKEKRLKAIKEELVIAKGWNDIGCKANPLPCMFLKNKAKSNSNVQELEAEADFIQDFLKEKNWANYKYLKYTVKPDQVTSGIYYSQEALDKIQDLLTQSQEWKAAYEANKALEKAKKAHASRLDYKRTERGSESLQELEDKANDLRFLVDLCGKNGLSLLVIDLVKIELQNIIDELLEFSELDIDIELSTSKKEDLDSLQILFGPKKIDVSKASGGEIALVRLIFKLALMTYLNRYFGAYKVLLIDEGGAALDSDNTVAVVNIIKKLCKEFNQIIYITHHTQMMNVADHKVVLN